MITMKKLLLFGLVTMLLVGTMTSLSVIAQDDEDNDNETDEPERSITVETAADRVEIESVSETEEQENAIEIEVDVSGHPEFRLEYYSETTSTEAETEIEVELFELIEFVDDNANGVFDGNETDTVVWIYDLGTVGYDPISYTTNTLESGVIDHVISFQSTDGVFQSVIHIVGDFANIEGTNLQPTSIKIDYIIANFNFTQTDSKLALYSEVESSSEVETESDDDAGGQIETDEEAVVQVSGGTYSYYSWENTAQVDGTTTDVLASYDDVSGSSKVVYLNYEQGNLIVHDPKIGVNLSTAGSGANGFLSFSPVLAVVLSISILAIGGRSRHS